MWFLFRFLWWFLRWVWVGVWLPWCSRSMRLWPLWLWRLWWLVRRWASSGRLLLSLYLLCWRCRGRRGIVSRRRLWLWGRRLRGLGRLLFGLCSFCLTSNVIVFLCWFVYLVFAFFAFGYPIWWGLLLEARAENVLVDSSSAKIPFFFLIVSSSTLYRYDFFGGSF